MLGEFYTRWSVVHYCWWVGQSISQASHDADTVVRIRQRHGDELFGVVDR